LSKRAVLTLVVLGIAGLIAGCEAKTSAPNVVLIIGDDISPDFSVYGGPVETPNIDSLALDGVVFENAYATASSCSPSRNSMITGRYPHNHGAPELHMELPAGQFIFTQSLKDANFYNAAAGKWHMGDVPRPSFHEIRDPGYPADPTGAREWVPLLKQRPLERPFFMWFAAFDAHRPWEPDEQVPPHEPGQARLPAGVPDTRVARLDMASYYDEVRRFDRFVGDVIGELKTQGIYEDTLIIVVGDNGRPFPRNKTSLYDNGMKVPLILSWPNGKLDAGQRSQSLVSLIDLAPTILDATNLDIPPEVQGLSLLPIAREPGFKNRQLLFGERNWHTQCGVGRMVRSENFTYFRDFTPSCYSFQMVDHETGAYAELLRLKSDNALTPEQAEEFSTQRDPEMLFDVSVDPEQLRNLVHEKEHHETLEMLRAKLAEWQKRTGDSIPELVDMTPDRHDRTTFERLYPGTRPPTGVVPGQKASATEINDAGPLR
jgi:N-sulfoglucosamine sulfohydrolase